MWWRTPVFRTNACHQDTETRISLGRECLSFLETFPRLIFPRSFEDLAQAAETYRRLPYSSPHISPRHGKVHVATMGSK